MAAATGGTLRGTSSFSRAEPNRVTWPAHDTARLTEAFRRAI